MNSIMNVTEEFLAMIKLPDENGRKLNYLMVVPVFEQDINRQYGFPIGFAYVSSALKASGRVVHTLNLNYKIEPLKLLRHAILTKEIDVLFTGGFAYFYWEMKSIIDEAKRIKPDIITVVGGHIVTASPEVAMEALENADYGIIGEAEITINALAYALETKNDAADIDGVICERDGKWSIRTDFPIVHDLDTLPFPDYIGLEYNYWIEKPINYVAQLFPTVASVFSSYIAFLPTSRSCPNRCTFCFHAPQIKYRQMSMDKIFEMLDWLLSLYPIDIVYPPTEMAFTDPKQTIEFCRRIKPYKLTWRMNTRATLVTKEMLEAAKDSGCDYIAFGIESADNRILKSMRKNITVDDIEKALSVASEAQMPVVGTLIFGDIEETMETFLKTINWWKTKRDWVIHLTLVCAYPGTHIYKVACDRGIIKNSVQFLKDGTPPVNISKMTDDEYYAMPLYFRMLQVPSRLKDVELEQQADFTLDVTGRCPHCKNPVYFYNYELPVNIVPKCCPKCKKEIAVNPIEHFDSEALNKNAEALIDGKPAAVWAVTHANFHFILCAMPCLKEDNVKFINKDRITVPDNGRVVKSLEGKEIFTPDVIAANGIETVIVPNNPGVFRAIKEQCAAWFPSVKRIVHITELL